MNAVVREPFADVHQQRHAAELGMWTFLATEVLFFGGLFLAYIVYRSLFPSDFAQASAQTNLFLGTLNTAILLTSSFTMAQSVNAVEEGRSRRAAGFLAMTVVLGVVFLCVKGIEYAEEINKNLLPGSSFHLPNVRAGELYFYIYFAMTGLHAIHVTAGLAVLAVIMARTSRRRYSNAYHTPVVVAGLYWHFVDIVWIFLYPLLYLIGRHV